MKNKSAKLALASSLPRENQTASSVAHDTLVAATSQIVSAYIINRGNESINLNALTADVYATLCSLCQERSARPTRVTAEGTTRKPVVSVEESVQADYLVCLEDGKRVKMLKRHLKTAYNMSPDQYRARWDLPATYPMVAPNYAKVRSQLAKQIGLGQRNSLPAVRKRMDTAANTLR
ncbi:MAG: MucR family transcriptional regulator [Alphaproteobacteria bacterium]|nr:MucR family transcriptional regulator [Alphaproteobacteria bacterium]